MIYRVEHGKSVRPRIISEIAGINHAIIVVLPSSVTRAKNTRILCCTNDPYIHIYNDITHPLSRGCRSAFLQNHFYLRRAIIIYPRNGWRNLRSRNYFVGFFALSAASIATLSAIRGIPGCSRLSAAATAERKGKASCRDSIN